MINMTTEEPSCGVNLILTLGQYYSDNISGYIDLSLCLIGSLLNSFNLMVFTRKHMISPANLIFTHLALVDLMVLLVDIPALAWHVKIEKNEDKKWSCQWIIIYLCCNYFIVTLHTVSVWLTVMLAIWRYIAVIHPLKQDNWCDMKTTRIAIAIGYVLCILLSTPMYFSHRIIEKGLSDPNTKPYCEAEFKKDDLLYLIVFLLNNVLLKLLPSILLTVFSFRLIVTLTSATKKTERLTSPSNCLNQIKHQVDRSTRILLTVLALFLIAEVPVGILGLLNVIHRNRSDECYFILGQIFDIIALTNTSVTFLVYCIMSQQFRATFKSQFSRNPVPFRKYPNARMISRNVSTETDTRQV